MSDPYHNHTPVPTEIDGPPRSVILWMLGLVVWLAIPWWIILGGSSVGELTFAVCVYFSAVAFGIAAICVGKASRVHWQRDSRQDASGPGAPRRLRIFTGSLPLDEATIQLLIVPASLAFGFTAIALAYAAVRASA